MKRNTTRPLSLYGKYLAFYPEGDQVRYFLGNALLHTRRYEDAIAIYAQSPKSAPTGRLSTVASATLTP